MSVESLYPEQIDAKTRLKNILILFSFFLHTSKELFWSKFHNTSSKFLTSKNTTAKGLHFLFWYKHRACLRFFQVSPFVGLPANNSDWNLRSKNKQEHGEIRLYSSNQWLLLLWREGLVSIKGAKVPRTVLFSLEFNLECTRTLNNPSTPLFLS